MYTTIKAEDAKKYDKLKLCYIDEINVTYWDFTPEAKAYRQTEEWKEQDRLRDEKFHAQGYLAGEDEEFGEKFNPIIRRGSECKEQGHPSALSAYCLTMGRCPSDPLLKRE